MLKHPDRYRIVPMPTERARFWHRRVALAAGHYAFGSATAEIFKPLGFSPETRMTATYLLGLGLPAVALEMIWRRPQAADPELGRHIIGPLKMQRVEQFGDYAIRILLKITTKPGEQFTIRRKAYAQIEKAFDENGIRLAFPTVQVAGGEDAAPAAARAALDNLHAEAASAA
jgi:small-conductance mechanosensitive channel